METIINIGRSVTRHAVTTVDALLRRLTEEVAAVLRTLVELVVTALNSVGGGGK